MAKPAGDRKAEMISVTGYNISYIYNILTTDTLLPF